MYEKNRIVDDGLRFYGRLHGYPRYRRWEKSLHQQLFVGRVVYQRISVPLRQINNSVAKKCPGATPGCFSCNLCIRTGL